jgi:hypothetical protein
MIVCCAIGIVSEKVVTLLIEDKYKDVFVLENGLVAWKLANLPLKSRQEMPCPCQCAMEKNKDINKDIL